MNMQRGMHEKEKKEQTKDDKLPYVTTTTTTVVPYIGSEAKVFKEGPARRNNYR